jgi:hypothetical protein
MAAETDRGLGAGGEEPLPPPWPVPRFQRFRKLTRRQSVIAWLVGGFVGFVVGAAAVMLLAPTHWL